VAEIAQVSRESLMMLVDIFAVDNPGVYTIVYESGERALEMSEELFTKFFNEVLYEIQRNANATAGRPRST